MLSDYDKGTVGTWRSVQPSKDIPPQTITDPLPNQSC